MSHALSHLHAFLYSDRLSVSHFWICFKHNHTHVIVLFVQSNLRPGNLLRFSVRDGSVKLVDGKMEIGELQLAGKLNRSRTFADSHSKVSDDMTMHLIQPMFLYSSHIPNLSILHVQVLFQYAARHAPLRIEDLVASVQSNSMEIESTDVEMQGWGEGAPISVFLVLLIGCPYSAVSVCLLFFTFSNMCNGSHSRLREYMRQFWRLTGYHVRLK